jgi:16S rRNA processing protein RimM
LKFSSNRTEADDLIQIGRIVGPHGIRGAVKVHSYAESMDCFAPQSQIILMDAGGSQGRYRVVSAQPYKNLVRLVLKDVTSRSQSETLAGCTVFMAKADLPPLEDDTYYWSDLIGMSVYTREEVFLGKLTEIIPTGANDVYVVRSAQVDGAPEILIPAITSVVLDIDVERRCMHVALPDGLMEP